MPAKKVTKIAKKTKKVTKKNTPATTKAKAATKKTVAKKKVAKKVTTRPKATGAVANNKSKIAPYKAKKNEKYMSAAMKRHFTAVLLNWKEHLKEEMRKTFDHLKYLNCRLL